MSFWTSGGAAHGELCVEENKCSWCSDGKMMKRQEITLPWADSNPPNANERCLTLDLKDSKYALDNVDCKADKYVICEV